MDGPTNHRHASGNYCFGASGAGVAGASGICIPGICCIPGMLCPGWGCIIAMLRQHGHPPAAGCPDCAPCADCPGWGCAWAVVMGRPHIIALAAVDPVWAEAWVIMGQARTGVAVKAVAKIGRAS